MRKRHGKLCKIQPSIATDGKGVAILGFQKLLLSGSDVFYGQYLSKSVDGGMTWSEPVEQAALADTHENGLRVARYATVRYAFKCAKWYAIGMAQLYEGDKRPFQKYVDGRPYGTPIFVSLDAEKGAFTGYRTLPFPFEYEMALPFGQALECENGDVIMPFYFRPIGAGKKSQCVTVRYAFDGDGMKVVAPSRPSGSSMVSMVPTASLKTTLPWFARRSSMALSARSQTSSRSRSSAVRCSG